MASPPRPYNSSNVAAAVELVRSGSGNTLADMIAFQGLAEETGIGNGRGKRQLYPVFEASEDMADEDVMDDTLHPVEKKRRLSIEQVKSLEKNFEIENKLEPERKLQLAKELGLQPRQVAVWFQNRRARWKTKQLEKDYDVLKSEFDTLKMNYEVLIQEKEKLEAEVLRLTDKLKSDESTDEPCAKENEPQETVVPFAKLDAVKIEEANEVGLPQIGEERSADNGVLSKPQKEGSLCSDSEVSEIMEAESGSSTAEDDQCFQLAGPLTDPATLAFVSEDPYCRVLLPVAYQRPVVKLEEGSLHEENYHMSFIFEDQGSLSFWDWP